MIIQAGIYRYRNLLNNHVYIGSTDNFKRRKKEQLNFNSCPDALKNAINKHGIDNFEYEIIEPIENTQELDKLLFREYIYEREQVWLDMYFAQEYVSSKGKDRRFKELTYNLQPIVKTASGVKWSEESKRNRSIAYKLNHPGKGIKRSEGWKLERSIAVKKSERYVGERNPNYGVKTTIEKRQKCINTKIKRGSITKFYRIDKELIISGPFYGVVPYAKKYNLQPRGINFCIFEPDKCKKYKGYTYCKEEDIISRLELIKSHPNFWEYHKFTKDYYTQKKLTQDGKI